MASKERGIPPEPLYPQQMQFADHYLVSLNATKAYEQVYGFDKSLGARKRAYMRIRAHRMLHRPDVQAYIKKRMDDRVKRTEVTQDKVVREIACMAFARLTDYVRVVRGPRIKREWCPKEKAFVDREVFEQYVEIVNTDDLTDEQKAALANIKEYKQGIEVNMQDKLRALELLSRHLGLFKENIVHTGSVPVKIVDDIE